MVDNPEKMIGIVIKGYKVISYLITSVGKIIYTLQHPVEGTLYMYFDELQLLRCLV